jgi:hypothetical protein
VASYMPRNADAGSLETSAGALQMASRTLIEGFGRVD